MDSANASQTIAKILLMIHLQIMTAILFFAFWSSWWFVAAAGSVEQYFSTFYKPYWPTPDLIMIAEKICDVLKHQQGDIGSTTMVLVQKLATLREKKETMLRSNERK